MAMLLATWKFDSTTAAFELKFDSFLINCVQIQEIKIFAYQQWLCPTGTTFEPKFLRLFSEVVHHIMYPK